MGLDMYLEGRKYVECDEIVEGIPGVPEWIDVKYTTSELVYWRKANAIHRWFVDNVQDGVDDCRRYDVGCKQLHELYDVVCEVLRNRGTANELLPTKDGFFFGETGYGECYFNDLEYTKQYLEKIFNEPLLKDFYISYRSSW